MTKKTTTNRTAPSFPDRMRQRLIGDAKRDATMFAKSGHDQGPTMAKECREQAAWLRRATDREVMAVARDMLRAGLLDR